MLGLTGLGVIHTAISVIAVVSGFWLLSRDREITSRTTLGKTYLLTTLATAVTGLGIFQHGGFGPPHALSILTLLALGAGFLASKTGVLQKHSRYLQAVCYTTTMLFHMIPGFTETLTRLPAGDPVFANADAPGLRPIYAALLTVYVLGLAWQLRWLRAQIARPALAAATAEA
jgi:uncharacterized membrane protein